ncbi:MAG: hypothetical protein WCG50_14715 [Rhodoferax sp.]
MDKFREKLIAHILFMKQHDPDYARAALKSYHEAMPWMELTKGVKEAMK